MLHVLMTVCVADAASPAIRLYNSLRQHSMPSAEVKFNTIKGLEAIRFQPSGLAGPCIENQLSYYSALCHLLSVCLEPAFVCFFKTSSCLILERERTANVG